MIVMSASYPYAKGKKFDETYYVDKHIPLVNIPLALDGAFRLKYAFRFSNNTLTLMAIVLAIGQVGRTAQGMRPARDFPSSPLERR